MLDLIRARGRISSRKKIAILLSLHPCSTLIARYDAAQPPFDAYFCFVQFLFSLPNYTYGNERLKKGPSFA